MKYVYIPITEFIMKYVYIPITEFKMLPYDKLQMQWICAVQEWTVQDKWDNQSL